MVSEHLQNHMIYMKRLGMAFAKGNIAFQNYFKISERLNKHGDKGAVVVKKKKK